MQHFYFTTIQKSKKLILVTGASGFLGFHLLDLLTKQPVQVIALYHSRKPQQQYPNVTWKSCDLLDIVAIDEVMKGITHIYHCAATVSFDPRLEQKMITDNVAVTANVVNAALAYPIERFIHVSSIAALGRTANMDKNSLISEDTHWEESKHNSAYAQSKYYAEMEVWRGMAEGLNAAIINPGIILGEGDWEKGSAKLMQVVYKEFPWYTQGINAWVDVKDVAIAMLQLMNSAITEERYIISVGNFSYLEIFSAMAEALNKKPPFKLASPFMSEIVWRAELIKSMLAGKEITISKSSARTAQTKSYYNNQKFLQQFPAFTYRPINGSIARMAQAFIKDNKFDN